MNMKLKRFTATVLVVALLVALLPAVSPKVAAATESEWVLASEAPDWAKITQRKYTYDLTTNTESTAISLAGYTQYDSYWNKTGSGAAHYASFPGGFDQTNGYYTGFMKSAYTASETQTAKREVSNVFAGYIYWHWMYDCGGGAASSSWRNIYYQKGTRYYGYKYFGAFASAVNYPQAPAGQYSTADANIGLPWYEVPLTDRKSYADTQGTRFWYRFNYYTSTYTDYQKIFKYTKTEKKESDTYPTGSGISNVQEWVKYLLQTNVSFDVNYDSVPVNHMRAPTAEDGWTLNADGTLSYAKSGVSVVYDPSDETFTFDTAGKFIENQQIELYRFPLDQTLPVGSYVNLAVRVISGSQTLDAGVLVLEGAPMDRKSITGERCDMGVFPPADGGWYMRNVGPLSANQSEKIQSMLIWLWTTDCSALFDNFKVQFSVTFTDSPLAKEELLPTPAEKKVYCGNAYGTLPQPQRDGYSFAGWYTQKNGGTEVTADTVLTKAEPHTLYASWTANTYALMLDKQDGTEIESFSVTYDKAMGTLPVPAREGYKFLGWYTEPNGGTLVESSQIVDFTESRTIYACWIPNELVPCGDGLSWTLEGNRLTLTGKGALMDYEEGKSPFSVLSGYIRELVIDSGVTSVGSYAFAGMSKITSLHLPQTVKSLGQGALDGCSALATLRVDDPICELCQLPENLTEIIGYNGSTAEAYATEKGITFRSLGFYQETADFSYWYRDDDDTLYIDGKGALPDYAVGEAPWYAKRLNLKAAYISGDITYIGNNTFAGCEKLATLSMPKTLKSFGENVFEDTPWYQSKPKGVVIFNGIVYGFRSGAEESNLVLSGGTTKIESNFSLLAREKEQSLKSLQISSAVKEIEDGALSWFSNLSELTVQNGNTAYRTVNNVLYTKDMKQLVCYPAGLEGVYRLPSTVEIIRPYAFAGNKHLREIHLGTQVTVIGANAFAGSELQAIHGYYDSYARQYALEQGYAFVPYTTTVTFDSNSDSEEIFTLEVYTGCAIGTLPTPAQPGYRFLGWFLETEQEDVPITSDYVVTEGVTLIAFWEELPIDGPYLRSLSIVSLPDKLSYYCGDIVSLEGLCLLAHYSDGTVKTVAEELACVPSRVNKPGAQSVTVYYAGLSVSYTVQVTEVVPVSLTLVSLPKVLTYYVSAVEGQASPLETEGLVGLVEFNNGTQRLINDSSEFEYIYDLSIASVSSTVNVNYRQGDVVVAAFYQVRVLDKPTIYSNDFAAKTGEEISIPVYISGNTGLMGLGLEIRYDPAVLEPESISANIAGTMGWNKGYGETGILKILWNHSEEYGKDGLLFTVNFRVLSDAESGESEISLAYLEEDSFNENYENIHFICSSVKVLVERVEKPTVYSEALSAEAGDYVDVPVSLKNNIGMEDLSIFTLSYEPSVFEYVEQVGQSDAILKITRQEGKLKIVLNEVPATREDGVLFTLRFYVKNVAVGNYRLSYVMDDSRWECADAQIQIVAATLEPTVSAEALTAKEGEQISVAMELSDNPGLMGYHLRMSYDSTALTVVDVIPNVEWGGSFDYAVGQGSLDILWANSENVEKSGVLFTLQISCATGGEFELKWESVTENTYNENWEEIFLACLPVSLTVKSHAHTELYQNNGDGTHRVLCASCGELLRGSEAHSYVNDVCLCGATRWILDSNIRIQHSLNLASDISINYVVVASLLQNYDSCYLECALPIYRGNTLVDTETVILEPVLNGSYYYFTLKGLSSVSMNDEVQATLRMTKNGVGYTSSVDVYSIAAYAYNTLNKTTMTDKMYTLCANLLRYGAAAQTYKEYRTDALADAQMTERHRSYLDDLDRVTFGNVDYVMDDLTDPAIPWVGKTLLLDSKIGIKFVFDISDYDGDVKDLSLRVSYKSYDGEEYSAILTQAEEYNPAWGYYSFSFYGLLAAEMRLQMEVAIYRGETRLSKTMVYCADSYGAKPSVTGALKILNQALFAYSDSALRQFAG